MKRKNLTRSALFTSIISLLLCVSMLVGTTFAWFTDSVTSANNIIKSGNLDVELEYKTSANGTWLPVTADTKLFAEGAHYEPGYTEVVFLRVSNAGSLALKYNLSINVYDETTSTNVNGKPFSLKDYLEIGYYSMDESMGQYLLSPMFGTREAALKNVTTTKLSADSGIIRENAPMEAGEDTALVVALVLTMPETVGNDANHKTGVEAPSVKLGINLVATQLTAEADSFGPDYDTNSEYPVLVATADELKDALQGADANTVIDATGVTMTGTTGLNINGATIVGATFKSDNIAVRDTIHGTFKDCTFEGSETLRWCYSTAGETTIFENCKFKTDFRGVHFDALDGNVIFKNCEINGFNALGGSGTVTFENCTFGHDQSKYNGLNLYMNTNLINCTFNYVSGKTNFIDMEGTGKTLTITNCTATLDGAGANVADFVGGSQLANNTVIYN